MIGKSKKVCRFEMQGGKVSQNAKFNVPSPCFFNSNTPSGIITPLRGNKGKKGLI